MVFKLAPAQQAALEKLLAEQQDPRLFELSQMADSGAICRAFWHERRDLAKVSAWLKSQGLTVDGFSRARTRVFFSGTAAQVENVFHTELHSYRWMAKPASPMPRVLRPQALSGMVLSCPGSG